MKGDKLPAGTAVRKRSTIQFNGTRPPLWVAAAGLSIVTSQSEPSPSSAKHGYSWVPGFPAFPPRSPSVRAADRPYRSLESSGGLRSAPVCSRAPSALSCPCSVSGPVSRTHVEPPLRSRLSGCQYAFVLNFSLYPSATSILA